MVPDQPTASDWAVAAALAIPHVLYAFVWFFPKRWMQAFNKDSVRVFEAVAWLLKVLQFSTLMCWYLLRRPAGIDLVAIPPPAWLAAAALGVCGQVLNVGIFRAIGHVGVYYGYKLGHHVPWVDGFPFNVVSHPQYVGSTLTVWAAAALLWAQAPQGLGLLAVYWTVLYAMTAWMESSLHV